jgi:hypothetical protein
MDWIRTVQDNVWGGLFEHGDELSSSIRDAEFLDQLSDYHEKTAHLRVGYLQQRVAVNGSWRGVSCASQRRVISSQLGDSGHRGTGYRG